MFEVNEHGATCLHYAVVGGSLPVMRYLVDRSGFDLSLRTAVSCRVVHDLIHPSIDFYKTHQHTNTHPLHTHLHSCMHTNMYTHHIWYTTMDPMMYWQYHADIRQRYCSPPLVDNMPTSMILFYHLCL